MSYDPRNFECDRFPGPPYEPEDSDGEWTDAEREAKREALMQLAVDLESALSDYTDRASKISGLESITDMAICAAMRLLSARVWALRDEIEP